MNPNKSVFAMKQINKVIHEVEWLFETQLKDRRGEFYAWDEATNKNDAIEFGHKDNTVNYALHLLDDEWSRQVENKTSDPEEINQRLNRIRVLCDIYYNEAKHAVARFLKEKPLEIPKKEADDFISALTSILN